MDIDYRLPGTDEPAIAIRRSALGGIRVFADGVRLRSRRSVFQVPMPDGTVAPLRVTGAWTGLRAIAAGIDTPLEPAVALWSRLLMLAPLVLIPIGGLVGGMVGTIGVAINSVIGRSSARAPVRAGAMVLVLGLAALAWLAIAVALTTVAAPKLSYDTGTCLDGVTPGADLVAHAPKVADCGSPHDNEIVGTFTLDLAGAYPGQVAIATAAQAQCPALFAAYVGIDFGSSRLDIVPVLPTQSSWATGDHEVACVAIATDGSKLTGSVKGTRQ